MGKKKIDLIILFVGIFIGFMFCLISINVKDIYTSKGVYDAPSSEEDLINRCSKESLEKTTECMVKNVRSIYRYTETDDSISLDLDDLIDAGGDCKDWTYFYLRIFDSLGYKLKTLELDNRMDKGHIFLVAYDESNYCIIDQTEYWCQELKFL